MNNITFQCDDLHFRWDDDSTLTSWLIAVAKAENAQIDTLTYIYCSDQALLAINKQYLEHDYFTDIITFDLSEGEAIEGDVFISVERVQANAVTFGTDFHEEMCRVHVHGLLHLIGYADKEIEEQKTMRVKEDTYLSLHTKVPRGTFGK